MFEIKLATSDDVEAIQYVLHTTWQDTYGSYLSPQTLEEVFKNWQSTQFLTKQITNPDIYFPLIAADKETVGLATAHFDGETITLFRIYVLPEYQGQGMGSTLLGNVIDHFAKARKIVLAVEKMNDKARQFYEKHGFKVIGEGQDKIGEEVIKVYNMEKQVVVM